MQKKGMGKAPGGPVVRTLHFHCRGHGSPIVPGWGTKIQHAMMWLTKRGWGDGAGKASIACLIVTKKQYYSHINTVIWRY